MSGVSAAAIRCAKHSESVSLAKHDAVGLERRGAASAAFSMMPLWTIAMRPDGVDVRVRVDVGRRAVGGPAGVADADAAGEALRQRVGEGRELAGAAVHLQHVGVITAMPAES